MISAHVIKIDCFVKNSASKIKLSQGGGGSVYHVNVSSVVCFATLRGDQDTK